jgi:hypothetical protein
LVRQLLTPDEVSLFCDFINSIMKGEVETATPNFPVAFGAGNREYLSFSGIPLFLPLYLSFRDFYSTTSP